MAIGSDGEIGVEFRTGVDDIHYPWIVNGERRQLMYGDSVIGFVSGRPDNVYPPDWDFVWCPRTTTPVIYSTNDARCDTVPDCGDA